MKSIYLVFISFIVFIAKNFAQPATEIAPKVFETLIFPMQPEHTHGSSIVSLPNGDILAAWFQGHGERTSDDVRDYGCSFKKRFPHLV